MKKTEQEKIDTHSDICQGSGIMVKHLLYGNSNVDVCTKFQESIGHEKKNSVGFNFVNSILFFDNYPFSSICAHCFL